MVKIINTIFRPLASVIKIYFQLFSADIVRSHMNISYKYGIEFARYMCYK